jgi:hypothetical protein
MSNHAEVYNSIGLGCLLTGELISKRHSSIRTELPRKELSAERLGGELCE